MKSTKVLVIGIDGGTFDLVRPWIKEGQLPTFRRLMEEGAGCDLTVELPPVTVPNWPSFMTGKNAGKHGVIHWFIKNEDLSRWSLASSHSIKAKTMWEIAGEAGKRSIVINVPATYPPRPFDGITITGLLTPPAAEDYVYPPEIKGEIESEVGKYHVYSDVTYMSGKEEKFLDSLLESLDMRFRTSLYLMENHPWDIFAIVFSESDLIQHMFWKFIDPDHPLYDSRMAEKYGNGMFRIYERIDRCVGEYLKRQGDDINVIVMSDHGADPFYQKFYTNNWLMDLGLMKIKKQFPSPLKHWAFRHGFTINDVYRLLMKTGFINWTGKVTRNESAESLVRKFFLSYEDVDWEQTSAFAFGGFGQIYLNLKSVGGTEPAGQANPSYTALRERIISGLRKIEIPDVGPFVEEIYTRDELYWGPNVSLLPDIVFIPRKGYLDPGDFEFSSNRLFDGAILGSGTHSRRGMFIIWGKAVASLPAIEGVRIHDIAPTVLYLAGVPVPGDMDGRVLTETLRNTWLKDRPVTYADLDTGESGEGSAYSKEDEEDIKKQLKGLGYFS
jgi:predicted AlkP superfamily phosphohydrolase/phosphomutase